MSMVVASLVYVGLLIVSFAHFMWGLGRKWPLADEAKLTALVAGRAGQPRMPPWYRSLAIAILTIAAAIFALALADHDAGAAPMSAAGALLALIFLARGVAGYLPAWRRGRPAEPYSSYNRRYYSPLSLAIGLGFAVLVLLRLV